MTHRGEDAEPTSLVLSLFSGAGLLDRGFAEEGCCVVSAGDLLWGADVRQFRAKFGKFDGVIGGSPCQDFSDARRSPPTGNGIAMLAEFARIVIEAYPAWWLLENVRCVPDVTTLADWQTVANCYDVQRLYLRADECGSTQRRLRCIQFGYRIGNPLVIRRQPVEPGRSQPAALASEGNRKHRRAWPDFCELQGLPRDFDLPGLTLSAKYRAVGNGVDLRMARVLAQAVKGRPVTRVRVCVCGCGRELPSGRTLATAACRKRQQRERDAATVTGPGPVTPAQSRFAMG